MSFLIPGSSPRPPSVVWAAQMDTNRRLSRYHMLHRSRHGRHRENSVFLPGPTRWFKTWIGAWTKRMKHHGTHCHIQRYVCPKNTHHTSYPTHFFLTNHMPYARKLFSRVDTLLLLAIETWSGTSPALRHSSYTHKEQTIRIYRIHIFLDVYTFTLYPLCKYLSVCIHTLNFANILQI